MTTHKQTVVAMIAANLLDAATVDREQRMHPNRVNPLDKVESLELEYQLIKEKKSNLSRANRDRVVYIVEHMEDIPDETE